MNQDSELSRLGSRRKRTKCVSCFLCPQSARWNWLQIIISWPLGLHCCVDKLPTCGRFDKSVETAVVTHSNHQFLCVNHGIVTYQSLDFCIVCVFSTYVCVFGFIRDFTKSILSRCCFFLTNSRRLCFNVACILPCSCSLHIHHDSILQLSAQRIHYVNVFFIYYNAFLPWHHIWSVMYDTCSRIFWMN